MRVLRWQCRRLWVVALMPPLICLLVVAVGLMLNVSGWWASSRVMVLMMALSQLPVIAAGVCGSLALTGDVLVELHESTPVGWRTVETMRLGVVGLPAIMAEAAMYFIMHARGLWPHDLGLASVLTPVGSVFAVLLFTYAAAVWLASAQATTLVAVAVWLFLCLLWDPYVTDPVSHTVTPVATAGLCALGAWVRCGDAERNVTKAVQA